MITWLVTVWKGIDWLSARISALMRGKPNWEDNRLKEEVRELVRDISDFLSERGYYIPETWQLRKIDDEEEKARKWHEMTNRSMQHSRETMNMYTSKYMVRLAKIREEFKKRGISNKRFEMMFEHPTNQLGIQSLIVSLTEMLAKIK